jgi:hypothetical protein
MRASEVREIGATDAKEILLDELRKTASNVEVFESMNG